MLFISRGLILFMVADLTEIVITEVLLWANRRWVTIKSKDQPRRTLDLKDAAALPDGAKRLKYVHDILAQLVST